MHFGAGGQNWEEVTKKERERERKKNTTCTYVHIYTYIYIYVRYVLCTYNHMEFMYDDIMWQ